MKRLKRVLSDEEEDGELAEAPARKSPAIKKRRRKNPWDDDEEDDDDADESEEEESWDSFDEPFLPVRTVVNSVRSADRMSFFIFFFSAWRSD